MSDHKLELGLSLVCLTAASGKCGCYSGFGALDSGMDPLGPDLQESGQPSGQRLTTRGASKTYHNKQVGGRLEETGDREEDPAAERTEGRVADDRAVLAFRRRRDRSFGTTERHGLDGVEDVGHARRRGRVR